MKFGGRIIGMFLRIVSSSLLVCTFCHRPHALALRFAWVEGQSIFGESAENYRTSYNIERRFFNINRQYYTTAVFYGVKSYYGFWFIWRAIRTTFSADMAAIINGALYMRRVCRRISIFGMVNVLSLTAH